MFCITCITVVPMNLNQGPGSPALMVKITLKPFIVLILNILKGKGKSYQLLRSSDI